CPRRWAADQSAAATSAFPDPAAAGDGWHVEENAFTNAPLSRRPRHRGQRMRSWPVHSRTRSIQLLQEDGEGGHAVNLGDGIIDLLRVIGRELHTSQSGLDNRGDAVDGFFT